MMKRFKVEMMDDVTYNRYMCGENGCYGDEVIVTAETKADAVAMVKRMYPNMNVNNYAVEI